MMAQFHENEAPVKLESLPLDELVMISMQNSLGVPDLLALACTCKRMCAVIQEPVVWEHRISAWLQRQDPRCMVLVGLGAWPSGLWWAESAAQPRGILVRVDNHGHDFVLSYLEAGVDTTHLWPRRHAVAKAREFGRVSIEATRSRWQGEAAELVARWQPDTRIVAASWGSNAMELVQEPGPLPPIRGWRQLSGNSPFGRRAEHVLMRRAATSLPGVLPAVPGAQDGLCLLSALQGVYACSYAGHGVEVVQVGLAYAQHSPPPGCSIIGPRLEAQKLTGDPNVPASKFSFVVAAANWFSGPYDEHRDDPFPADLPRPLVAFPTANGPLELVDLAARPVVAVFPVATGQINRVPGTWQPEWEPATLVMYRGEGEGMFSVIFEQGWGGPQPAAPVRLIKDFFPAGLGFLPAVNM